MCLLLVGWTKSGLVGVSHESVRNPNESTTVEVDFIHDSVQSLLQWLTDVRTPKPGHAGKRTFSWSSYIASHDGTWQITQPHVQPIDLAVNCWWSSEREGVLAGWPWSYDARSKRFRRYRYRTSTVLVGVQIWILRFRERREQGTDTEEGISQHKCITSKADTVRRTLVGQ